MSSRASSASADPAPFAAGGGAFAGAGASENWAQTSTVTEAVDDGESPFSAEDYAAFDALSDYDRSSGVGDGFDS